MSTQFTFRPLETSDSSLIKELIRAYYDFDELSYDPSFHGPALEQLIDGNPAARTWIVEADGTPAGYLILTISFSIYCGGKDGFIDELFLKEEFRGLGGGAEIMNFADKMARELGLITLHLEVTPQNDHARQIYERRGFAPTGHILMSKRIVDN